MALPHSGNWDMAGVWMVQHFGTFTTVAERLKPESLYQRFIDYRESLGFEMLPLTGGERPPFEVLAERLRDNGMVCLMADRDLTRSGVQVDFFGEPTRMPAGSAKLAIETGAVAAADALLQHARQLGVRRDRAAGHVVGRRRRDHPGDGRPVRQRHRRPSRGLAHAAAAVAGRPVRGTAAPGSGARPDAHRHGVPVLVRRPRRRAVPCAATGRGDAGPRPRRQRAGAVVAARLAARLRRLRRQGRADSVQRVGGAAAVRPGNAPQGQTLADRRRLRRAAPARAQRAQPVDAGADDRRGTDRRDLSHLDHEIADAVGLSGHPAALAREDRRPHRGVRPGAALADGGARLGRRRDPQRCRRGVVRRGALGSTDTRGRASRCCSSAASTSRARAWRCWWLRCPRWSSGSPTSRS